MALGPNWRVNRGADLVARLRQSGALMGEAADEIERLLEEVENLNGIITNYADACADIERD